VCAVLDEHGQHLIDELPKTTVGKIDKKALRAVHWAGTGRQIN